MFYASRKGARAQKTKQTNGGVPVARQRNPKRAEVMKSWLESGGTLSIKELAAAAGVPEASMRKWKSLDKWQNELDAQTEKQKTISKKRGGQKGNTNAAGHGAPEGNTNAETHGAYSQIHFENLSDDIKDFVKNITLDVKENLLRQLQILYAKERDILKKIAEYENAKPGEMFTDRVVEMLVPKSEENQKRNPNAKMKIAMQNVIKSSAFDRIMRLEIEYNKIHGRISKLLDTLRAYGIDTSRIDLDERKHRLAKQRLTGEYSIDPATGELDDGADVDAGEDVQGDE